MRNIIYITAMLAVVSIWGYFVTSMQNQPAAAKHLMVTAAASDTNSPATRAWPTGTPATATDAQRIYKAHCSGCHATVRRFPEPMIGDMIQHMLLQTSMTTDEIRSLLGALKK